MKQGVKPWVKHPVICPGFWLFDSVSMGEPRAVDLG